MSGALPPSYPPPYQASPPQRQGSTKAAWIAAFVTGCGVYVVLVVLHNARSDAGTAAYRAGEMFPIAAVSAGLVGLVGQLSSKGRPWVVALVPVGVFLLASFWYVALHVLPDVADDLEAERSGQSDYELETPSSAGDWTLLSGQAAERREAQAREMMAEQAPAELSENSEMVYGEYERKGGQRLLFIGWNASGPFEDQLRESEERVIGDVMAGAGVDDFKTFDAGDLGGELACTDDVPSLPATAVVCVWTDASTVGQVITAIGTTDLRGAADLTRELRGHVTRR